MAEKATLARQDISLVNARQYGSARNHTTIQLALDAIGNDYQTLILTDEGDGVWTLGGNITIPANVTLHVPLGVAINGSGNLTILGGLVAWKWPVYSGSGTFTWSGNVLAYTASKLRTYQLDATTATFDTLSLTDKLTIIPNPPPPDPPDIPTEEVDYTDFGVEIVNYAEPGGGTSKMGAINARQYTKLTANLTALGGRNFGIRARPQLNLNSYHFDGFLRGAHLAPCVFGASGTLDYIVGAHINLLCMESSVTTQGYGIYLAGVYGAPTTGTLNNYTGILLVDINASRVTSAIRGIQSGISIQGAEDRYNLYISGTAPNYFAGNVGIAGTPTSAKLFVNGTASKPGGGSWTDSSSATLKTDITPISDALTRLLALEGKYFRWSEPTRAAALPGIQGGLIAENVQDVFPEWIEIDPNTGLPLLTTRGELAYIVEALRTINERLTALEQAV